MCKNNFIPYIFFKTWLASSIDQPALNGVMVNLTILLKITIRTLSNVSMAQVGIVIVKTTTEVDAPIVWQHGLARFRSPSELAIEVNVCNRTLRRLTEILLIQLSYQTKPFYQSYSKIRPSIELWLKFFF